MSTKASKSDEPTEVYLFPVEGVSVEAASLEDAETKLKTVKDREVGDGNS